MTQVVKNQPAMQETWVQFLGWEDPLENGVATHSTRPENSWNSQSLWDHKESDTTE